MIAPWKILHVELSEGIPDLLLESKYQGLFVVFWWNRIPLGQQKIPAAQLPISAAQLANHILRAITPAVGCHLLDRGFRGITPTFSTNPKPDVPPDFRSLMVLEEPLKRLEANMPAITEGSISVVICTRDRPLQLDQCLKSLQNLSCSPHEIIVVDNAPSTDATRRMVSAMPGIRYVLEPRPGLSIARNTGIFHSTGDIVAFTDDDVVVHPDWTCRLLQGFNDPKVMAVTGLVIPAELETEAQLIFQNGSGGSDWPYQSMTFDHRFFEKMKPRGVPVWWIGAGANMAFRREAFELAGTFDERLGAGAAGCSEDSEMWYRILAEGWICRYEPTAVVHHYHRREMGDLNQQMYQYMRGHVTALLIQFTRYRHWGNLLRLCAILPGYFAKLLLKGFIQGFGLKHRTCLSEMFGSIAGIGFYLKNRILTVNSEKRAGLTAKGRSNAKSTQLEST